MTDADGAALVAALRSAGLADVSDSTLTRALYSSDASLYRVLPLAVAHPRSTEEVLAALAVAREAGVPVTMRGAGTSIAGNAVGPGLVLDTSRHLTRVLALDAEARTATVEPGVVHAALQRRAAAYGLRFGPDPSTHTRCTVGGMLGNNACGSRALGWGRTSDNVESLRLAFGNGEVASTAEASATGAALAALVADDLGHVRTHFGRFSRQVSGYALEHLLPERHRLDRFLVGSEGTLGVVLEAILTLVPEPPARALIVLGYPSMADAADAVPALLAAGPMLACEGLDRRLVDAVRGRRAVPDLPRGAGWLFVEVAGATSAAAAGTSPFVSASGSLGHSVVVDPDEQRALWAIREDGAGLAARSLDRPAHAGWEDAAVPPERLGDWLREWEALLAAHGLHTVPYGHFGDGCVHARIDFAFDASGRQRFREFLEASADALRAHGGSLSGEHGDGRARSELLPRMYDERSLALFAAVKHACDPDRLLNPGVLVDPAPLDEALRPVRPRHEPALTLRLSSGSFGDEVHRCTGVGACVSAYRPGVMCPSWQATREEKDSTRGRARVLQEALDGSLVGGLSDPAVTEALDLCLSCKGCARDCPTGVDMAAHKSEVLHRVYADRRRPLSHVVLGRLPAWVRRARRLGPVARLVNPVSRGAVGRLGMRVVGIDPRRSVPALAPVSLRASARRQAEARAADPPDVWVWADTFTDHFLPDNARAAVDVLAAAGLTARVLDVEACCALTWISTGQLDAARAVLDRSVAALAPYADRPILGLEPSCVATLRSDALHLSSDDRAGEVAASAMTLAELLERFVPDWQPPDLTGVTVVAQPHCHHASVLGWEADERLLRRAGATVVRVDGCCGLAGNFGMEAGHYDVSVAVAESHLLPAVRAHPDAIVLADGLSCRHQLADLADTPSFHLAELLAGAVAEAAADKLAP